MRQDRDAGTVEPLQVEVPPVLVHALAHRDRGDGERDLVARACKYLRGVQPGRVAAPVGDDDSASGHGITPQHRPGLAHVALERQRRQVWRRAGGHDHRVRVERADRLRRRIDPQAQVDRLERAGVVGEEPVGDRLHTRSVRADRKLSADAVRSFEHHHVMAGGQGGCSGREPRRPGADDDDASRTSGRRRAAPSSLPPGTRVDGAPDCIVRVVVRDARLAADAPHDRAGAAGSCLVRKLRVGDQRARHPERVRGSRGDDAVRLDDIDHARGGDQRQPYPERLDVREDRALRERRRWDDQRRAEIGRRLTERDAEVVDLPGEERSHAPCGLGVRREAHADAEPGTGGADGSDDREQKTGRLGPVVVPAVERRVEELRDEVAMGGGDFDAVEAALRRTPRCLAEAVHDLLDFAAAERAWRHAKALARNRRGRESRSARRPGDLLATAVEQLHEETSAVRLYGLADPSVGGGHLGEVSRQLVRGEDSRWMGCGRLEDDQPGASARPGLVVGDEVVGGQVVVDERGLVRGRHDPVLQLDRPEPQRAEQVLKGRKPGVRSFMFQA